MFFDTIKDELINESYIDESVNFNVDDSMNVVIESYINDYTIFEAVLRRDLLEANGVLTEEADGNFLSGLWEKIKGAFKKIIDVIVGAFNNVIGRIERHKQEKANKLVAKYSNLFKTGDLSEFTYKCKTMKDFDFPTTEVTLVDYTNANEENLKKYMEGIDVKKAKEELHKEAWGDSVEKPFANNNISKDYVIEILSSNLEYRTDLKKTKKVLLDNFNKKHEFAKKKQKEVKKDKNMSKEDKDKEIKLTQSYLKAVNVSTKYVSTMISAYLKELTGHYKLSYTLFTKASKYLEKKTGTKVEEPDPSKVKSAGPTKMKGEVVDDGTPKRPESKEDFDNIRQQSVEDSYLYDNDYINAVLEAELYEYNL